jgi:hypothetical protein
MRSCRWYWLACIMTLGLSVLPPLGCTHRAEDASEYVLVAKESVTTGTLVKDPEAVFSRIRIASEFNPPTAVREFRTVEGKVLRNSLEKGKILIERDLVQLPSGTEPVIINVGNDEPLDFSGKLVDVRIKNSGKPEPMAVVENALVLAWDLDQSTSNLSQLVVLALTPDQAKKVRLLPRGTRLTIAAPDGR